MLKLFCTVALFLAMAVLVCGQGSGPLKASLRVTRVSKTYFANEPINVYTVVYGDPGRVHYVIYAVDGKDVDRIEKPAYQYTLPFQRLGGHQIAVKLFDNRDKLLATENLTIEVKGIASRSSNGIVVAKPKEFDEKALYAMLQTFESALAGSGTFFDKASIQAGIGRIQGGTADISAQAMSIAGLPSKGVTTTQNVGQEATSSTVTPDTTIIENTVVSSATPSTTTKTTTADGTTVTVTSKDTSSSSKQVTTPSVNPNIPQATAPSRIFSSNLPFGLAAQDVLADQVNLGYQVMNLRMLLQGSLTDRYMDDADKSNSKIKLQRVLGFQISLDPRTEYRNAVAEVEVEFYSQATAGEPTVVSMMPQENTYNSVAITQRSEAFSLGGIVGIVNAGISTNKSSEQMYLIRDQDTIALHMASNVIFPGSDQPLRFGWQFRPVLGRSTVTPGTRQLFAQLAFPNNYGESWNGTITITTRWRRYDRKSRSVGDVIDGSESIRTYGNFPVRSGAKLDDLQLADLGTVNWTDIGSGRVVINAAGDNLLSGSAVQIGSRFVLPGVDLLLESRVLSFAMPASDFATMEPYLINPYGKMLIIRKTPRVKRSPSGSTSSSDAELTAFKFISASATPKGPTLYSVDLVVQVDNTYKPKPTITAQDAKKLTESRPEVKDAISRLHSLSRAELKRLEDAVELGDFRSMALDVNQPALRKLGLKANDIGSFNTLRDVLEASNIDLVLSKGADFEDSDPYHPLAIIGSTAFGLRDTPVKVYVHDGNLHMSFDVARDLVKQNKLVTVVDPLWGPNYLARAFLDVKGDNKDVKAVVLSIEDDSVLLGLENADASVVQEIWLGNVKVDPSALATRGDLLCLSVTALQARSVRSLLLVTKKSDGKLSTDSIAFPFTVPASSTSNFAFAAPVLVNDAARAVLKGDNIDGVTAITCEGKRIDFGYSKDGSILVKLERSLTAKAATIEFEIILKDGSSVAVPLLILERPKQG